MSSPFLRGIVSGAAALLMVTAAGRSPGAASAPPEPRQAAPAPAAAPPSATFRASTQLVQVDVIVEDSKGRFVPNLTRKDFQVFENGKRQPIETFSLVGVPSGPTPSATPGAATPPAAAAAPAERRIFILVFDDRHLLPGGFTNVQRAAEQFLDNDFRNGDIGGVVANDEMVGNRLTTDRTELLADLAKARPRGHAITERYNLREWPRLLGVEEAQQIVNGNSLALSQAVRRAQQDMPQTRRPVDVTPNVKEKAREVVVRAQRDANETLNTLAILMAGLAKFPGPKSIVFFSDGFFSDQSWPQLQQVVGLAARAGVRIYSVDARGLNLTSTNESVTNPGRTDIAGSTLFAPTTITGSSGPNSLAVDTGGFVTRYTNNFTQALQRIAQDGRVHYLIGYRPTNTDFNGKFRTIRVKVRRHGLMVRARRGYLAVPPPTLSASAAPATAPAPASPPPAAELPPATARAPSPAAPTVPPTAPSPSAPASPPPAAPTLLPKGPEHVAELQRVEPVVPQPPTTAAPAAPGGSTPPPGQPQRGALRQPAQPAAATGRGSAAGESTSPETGHRASPAADSSTEAQRAWNFYEQGNLEAAATAFEKAVTEQPDARPWVHYAYGLTQYGLSKFPQAIAQWIRVRDAVPDFEPVYFDLADGYARAGDTQEALRILRTASRRWARDPQVFNAMGVIQVRLGVLDDAVRSFEQATRIAPAAGLAYFNLGKTLALRYARSRRYVSSAGAWASNDGDRQGAMKAFKHYLKIGGPFADQARAELLRLQYEKADGQPR